MMFRKIIFIWMVLASVLVNFDIQAQNAWINEIHYDNEGTDVNEFIEVVVEFPESYNLTLFEVILYNGNGGASYDTKTLDQFTVGTTVGNFTIYYYIYPVNGIQNGDPDGMAISYNGTLISGQFLSYEGIFTASNGPANGIMSTDIGVEEDNPIPSAGQSLQLAGSGSQYGNFSWLPPATATAGTLNNGQLFSESISVDNPSGFTAITFSPTQINLTWDLNPENDDVMLAWSASNNFGIPSGTYDPWDPIPGGGTVLYTGNATAFEHTGLTTGMQYFYKAWSMNETHQYSPGVTDSAYTQSQEPTNHPSGFMAALNSPVSITVTWSDSDAMKYLIKGSDTGYGSIISPIDGIPEPDDLLVKNVPSTIQKHVFTGLVPNTRYYFKSFPYNGIGEAVDYKTGGDVPETFAKTNDLGISLIISEVADPRDSSLAKFVEIYNAGDAMIDFSNTVVYLCRQANGSTWGSVQLTGTLNAGETHTLSYNSSAFTASYDFSGTQNSGIVSGNGNDGYFLFYGGNQNSGFLLDAFGVINEDGTGKAWEYTDKKAVRKRNVAEPNPLWTPAEWIILPVFAMARDMTPGYHSGEVTWLGAESTNWNEKGGNWNSPNGYIPDASCIVTIPESTIAPIVTGPSACHELLMQNGSSLLVGDAGSLLITGP